MFRVKSSAVSQGYDSIKVPCRNGLTFEEGNQVVFDLTRDIGMANLKNACLEFDINLNGSTNAPLAQIVKSVGANALFNRVTIRSMGRVLEQLDNYNLYANMVYLASEDEGTINRRSVNEGCAPTYKILDNPYVTQNQSVAQADTINNVANSWRYKDLKVQVPLLGGIFQNPQNHPLMAVPLEVEIILEKNNRVLYSDPVLQTDIPCEDFAAGAQTNLVLSDAYCQKLGIIDGGQLYPAGQNNSRLNRIANLPIRVGQRVLIAAAGGAGVIENAGAQEVASISVDAATGRIVLGFAGNIKTGGGTNTGVTCNLLNGGGLFTNTVGGVGPQTLKYQVKNPRLIVPKVIPSPEFTRAMSVAMAKGMYAMDILSYTDYLTNIVGTTTASTNLIPADLSRVKSLLNVPVEQINLDLLNNTNALHGSYMGAQSYEYQINNQMRPSRLVDLSREAHLGFAIGQDNYVQVAKWCEGSALGAVHCYEVEKALTDAGIEVKNLRFLSKTPDACSLKYEGNFLVGRTLGPLGMSENLMGISSLLYLNYDGSNTNLKLLHNYAVHVRTIALTPAGIELRY
jgi:hypothetical protein